MSSWDEIERLFRKIISPLMDSEGHVTRQIEGAEHLLELLPLLRDSRVLAGSQKRMSLLSIILTPPHSECAVHVVPPSPLHSGSVEHFRVAWLKDTADDVGGAMESRILHYEEMDEILQTIEDFYRKATVE